MPRRPKKIPQKTPRRTRKNVPKGFDSWFEFDLSKLLRQCHYHTQNVDYVIKKKYEPDFIFYDNDNGKAVYIESKGRFRTREEASKYVAVREALSKFEELVFIFYNPMLSMPGAKVRRDGTKQSHCEWAALNDFKFYTIDDLPKEWRV